ncbi:AAWKG family protein, partial [Streptomyces sp. NPDC054863]
MPDPALPPNPWDVVVKQITGFDAGTRYSVGAVGGANPDNGDGSEWLIFKKNGSPTVEEGKRTISYMDVSTRKGNATYLIQRWVDLRAPLSSSNGSDFSASGNAAAFYQGYGDALEQLVAQHTTVGFGSAYPHKTAVPGGSSIELKTFAKAAAAFDRVTDYFETQTPKLAQWVKELEEEHSAYQGNGADVFKDLIEGLSLGYKDILQDLSSKGNVTSQTTSYTSGSSMGDKLMEAEGVLYTAIKGLRDAWTQWKADVPWPDEFNAQALPDQLYLPIAHLNAHMDKISKWLNENNLTKATVNMGTEDSAPYIAAAGFLEPIHPDYGDLRTPEAWKEVGRKAYGNWQAYIQIVLDPAATRIAKDINNAFRTMGTFSVVFNPGFTSLKEANAVDEAAKTKADLEKEKSDAKAEIEKEKEEAKKEKEEAKKEIDEMKGGGKDGPNGIKPPPDLNDIGGNGGGTGGGAGGLGLGGGAGGLGGGKGGGTGGGTGGAGGENKVKVPPPSLNDLGGNGVGPGGAIKNPDGSISVKNPDGSTTTTFPDGHKETTPAGVLPPNLNPIGGGGGWGTGGGGPVKTVKGPDGSTTSYNADGSRTTTHKDGTTTTVNPDGTSVTNNPDGSRTVLNKDGSQTVTYQDGSKATVRPDGTTITQYPDGTSTKLTPDGTLTTTDAQGNSTTSHPQPGSTVKNPDGSSTVFGKDGATTTTHADGTKTTVSANGTVTTVDPDGTKTVSHLGKGTSTITYADGSVAQVGRDGTVSTTYKDGSNTRIGPDGTYTTTDADGNKKTEHLNTRGGPGPAQTTHNPDGSTTTKYPDGTVDKQLKNGGHQITYPDGRTVTTDQYGRTTGNTGSPNLNNIKGGGSGNYDYYDYPESKKKGPSLTGGGIGGGQGPG